MLNILSQSQRARVRQLELEDERVQAVQGEIGRQSYKRQGVTTPVERPLHKRSRHQNQAIDQKLGILGWQVLISKSTYQNLFRTSFFSFFMTNFNENRLHSCGALRLWSVRLWSGAPTGVRVFSQTWEVYQALNMHIRQ